MEDSKVQHIKKISGSMTMNQLIGNIWIRKIGKFWLNDQQQQREKSDS